MRFTNEEGRIATIAACGDRVMIQDREDCVISRPSIRSAIAWLEARGWSILIDEWRVY